MRARALLPAMVAALLLPPAAAAKPRPLMLRWLHMVDRAHGYAISGVDSRGYRLLRTDDGGRRWADITPGKGTIHPSGAATVAGRTILFGTQRGPQTFAVERSDDGGRTWRMSAPLRDTHPAGIGAPTVVDATHFFVALGEGAAAGSEAESLWASGDGGRTWRFVSRTGFTVTRPGQLPFGCDKDGFGFATTSRGWAGGFCPGGAPFLYRTVDGGRTWHREALPGLSWCECDVSPPRFFAPRIGVLTVMGWARSGTKPLARVYWTADGGLRWRASVPTAGRPSAAVSIPNAQTVWLDATRPGSLRGPYDRLLRTDDAGRRWHSLVLPFDGGNYALDALDASVAFAYRTFTRSTSILRTTDGGRHWIAISSS
ncbi:MAG TPA: sialidase family protein [Gaiellaceae bacterium]|nr:sialidase family protein [Gaiellaceae bacterium]